MIGREVKKGKTTIQHGKIKKINGQWMEEVVFSKGSVGTLVKQTNSNQLVIKFNDCDDCSLVFKRKSKSDGRYLLHTRGNQEKRGQVSFDGNTYFASANSHDTYLLVKIKEVSNN